MSLSLEAERLYNNTKIRTLIRRARNDSKYLYHCPLMPWGNKAEVRREGSYPLVSAEGNFDATLWRTIPFKDGASQIRGGEFRILANQHLTEEMSFLSEKLSVIVDTIPSFLKELSDPRVQQILGEARAKIATLPFPAALIQNRASDVHDGEYRNTSAGQLDIQEEIWYAKALRVMKRFPSMTFAEASVLLIECGEKPFFEDYALGFTTLIQECFDGRVPVQTEMEVISLEGLVDLFNGVPSWKDELLPAQRREIVAGILDEQANTLERKLDLSFGSFIGKTLADYPIMQNGIEFRVRLVIMQRLGENTFKTFRIIERGDQNDAYVRIDSICINGLQAGDNHCDCRKQSEAEKDRAESGLPMMLINIRDDEGKYHGEGMKGGTLAVQRAINKHILDSVASNDGQLVGIPEIGNALAAQLFYNETGEEVDARNYDAVTALFAYLGIEQIPHLVTNNQQKIAALSRVSVIREEVSAKVFDGISLEAQRTIMEKENGFVPNVIYK